MGSSEGAGGTNGEAVEEDGLPGLGSPGRISFYPSIWGVGESRKNPGFFWDVQNDI